MVAVRGVVDPIFQVVLVPALVVQPGRAVSFGLALGVVELQVPCQYLAPAQNSTGASLLKSWVSPCQYSPQRKQCFITSIL